MKRAILFDADKARNLRYTTNALVELQEELGAAMFDEFAPKGLKEIRTFIYYGLKHEDPSLTLDKVGDIMDDFIDKYGMDELAAKFNEALELAQGKKIQK